MAVFFCANRKCRTCGLFTGYPCCPIIPSGRIMATVQTLANKHNSLTVNDLRPTKTIFMTSFAIAIVLLLFSPNFNVSKLDRVTPLGSDFLQEWTGGYIWSSGMRSELYNPRHFKQIQHDAAIVGFNWPESQYYPMVYPPFYYMVLSPLSQLPYWLAVMVWVLVLATATATTIWLWTSYYPPAKQHWGKCLFATIAFFPLLVSLNTAHKSVFLLLIICSTYLLLYRKKPLHAGLVFGLIAFKPHVGILIGVVMLLKQQWQFVVGSLATVLILVGLSFVAGADLCHDFFRQCLTMGDFSSNGGYLFAESHNLTGALSVTFGAGTVWTTVLSLTLAALVLLAIAISTWGDLDTSSPRFAIQFSILVLATILLSPHFYIYDLAIVLLPLALIAFQLAQAAKISKDQRVLIWLCVSLFSIVGMATGVAEKFGIQPTLLILLAMILYLVRIGMNQSDRTSQALAANLK